MKFIKKLLVVLVVAFAALVVVGCKEDKPKDLESDFKALVEKIEKDQVTSDIVLPTTKGDIKITWMSSNPEVVSNSGVVTRQATDVTVRLTAIMKLGEVNQSFFIDVTVKAKEKEVVEGITIAQVLASEEGVEHHVLGTVAAINAQSFVLSDSTGSILVFRGNGWEADVVVGDQVVVTGVTSVYGLASQFGKEATYVKAENKEFTQPEAKELTAEEITAYATKEKVAVEYVKVTGKLAVSGTYFNLNFDGVTTVVGSLSYPVDADTLTALNGKTLEVYGYVTGLTGSNKYLNLLVVSYKEVEALEVEYTEKTVAEVLTAEAGNYLVKGTVAAIYARGFMLSDATGSVLVFKGNGWEADVVVGDEVEVKGLTTTYGLATQFDSSSEYTKGEKKDFTQPEAKVLTNDEIKAYATAEKVTAQLVKVTGKLALSGNYLNLTFDGVTEITGSIQYPVNEDTLKALDGKTLEVTGYVTSVSGSSTKYLNLLVVSYKEVEALEVEYTEKTVAEVLTAEAGNYLVKGTVAAIYARGFIVSDTTGSVLVYKGSKWTADVVVGDEVEVKGKTAVYNLGTQFGDDATYTKGEKKDFTQPTAKELTAEQITAYATAEKVTSELVKVTGVLSVSGSYYNLTIADVTAVTGSIQYPVNADSLKALDGKALEVTGYVTSVSGSSTKFLNLIVVSYEEVTIEITYTEKTVAEVLTAEAGNYLVKGTVAAVYKEGFLVSDATGSILVYQGTDWTTDVAVGDKVEVKGLTAVHALAKQFGNTATYTKGESTTFTQPEAKELTAEQIAAYATKEAVTAEYVKVKAKLVVSGKYLNLEFKDVTAITGSVLVPADADALKALDGKTLEILGYATGVSGSTTKRINIIVISYTELPEEQGGEPEPIVNGIKLVTKDLVLANATEFTKWEDADKKVTITADKGTNSNTPKYFSSGEAVRVYAGSTLKVAAISEIDYIEFTINYATLTFNSIIVTGGTVVETETGIKVTANAGAKEIVVSTTGTSGHIKYVAINVVLK